MKGWSIFAHSVGMVTRNLSEALRIALVPVLIGFVLIAAVVMTSELPLLAMADQVAVEQMLMDGSMGAFIMPLVLSILIFFTIELWIFVSWHRFILLEEYPNGWVPSFRFDRILSYFGNGFLIGIIVFVLWIPAMILAALTGPFSIVIVLGTMIFMVVLIYRLVAILPAAAIGKSLKVSDAWEATRGSSGTILVLVLVIFLAQILLQFVSGLSMMIFAPLGIAFQLFTALVMSLVNVSILTTFYGHYVEGREIG